MKKNAMQKTIAFLLALMMLLACGLTVGASDDLLLTTTASNANSSVTDKTIADYADLLNSLSYDDYLAQELYADYKTATKTVRVDGWNYDAANTTAKVSVENFEGVQYLYVPADGVLTYVINVPETAKYSIAVRYFAPDGKNAAIERKFRLNGELAFEEVASLSFPKTYANVYTETAITVDASAVADYLSKAKEYGLTVTQKTNDKGQTVLTYSFPQVWVAGEADYLASIGVRFFTTDVNDNELRPSMEQVPTWSTYELHDVDGLHSGSFEFYMEKGENVLSFEGVAEPIGIAYIEIYPHEDYTTYDEYYAAIRGMAKGTDIVKLEGEYTTAQSANTVYPVEDRSSSACSPADVNRTVLNCIGGDKWKTAGKALSYTFKVDASGIYNIVTRFKQDLSDGVFTCRALYIYSGAGVEEGELGYYDGIPFEEASRLQFNYDDRWQTGALTTGDLDENGDPIALSFYFKEGVTYTLKFEVSLGAIGPLLQQMENILENINEDYLTILKLTGATPDIYRDYGFYRVMPDTCRDLIIQSRALYSLSDFFKEVTGESSSVTAVLEQVAQVLKKMGTDEDDIAPNLSNLESHIATIGTYLTTIKQQPLYFDYILIQSADEAMPRANGNFFQNFWHEVKSFFASFSRDYNSLGTTAEMAESLTENDAVVVWLQTGRDQAQVIRNLCTNGFTGSTGISVDLKLVAGGTLLPSILSGEGPDVFLGLGSTDVINYAIRGALLPVEGFDGFEETTTAFTESAMLVLGIEDKYNVMHYYGLPEQQTFQMMFVRVDILSNLGVEIPKTWESVFADLPILDANNMEIGILPDLDASPLYTMFMYQNEGNLFADNGMRINLDSIKGLDSFETMCNLYTVYSFPYAFDAATRFRSGEMPIVIRNYTDMYNTLKVYANEIDGLWTFVPVPGTEDANGNINNCVMSSVTADVLVKGCRNLESSWEFLRWFTGAQAQSDYAKEMVAILGDSAKQATANRESLVMMPWTTDEISQIMLQFENLAAIPNYPGYYILARYTKFAFLSAYNEDKDPVSEILSYINTINKEITRKRDEFELETLTIGQTLAEKRKNQCVEACAALQKAYGTKYDELIADAKYALANKETRLMREAAQAFDAKLASAVYDDYFVYVSHQTMEKNKGGYSIDSLNELQLIYFVSKCLTDAADAYDSY